MTSTGFVYRIRGVFLGRESWSSAWGSSCCEERGKSRRGVGLHAGEDVLVGDHGEGGAWVPEPFGDDFHRDAGGDEQRRVRVAKIMQADPGNRDGRRETVEGLGQRVRVQASAASAGEHRPVV